MAAYDYFRLAVYPYLLVDDPDLEALGSLISERFRKGSGCWTLRNMRGLRLQYATAKFYRPRVVAQARKIWKSLRSRDGIILHETL